MAGEGYRIWTPGEVITADNIQQYLQDQAVQVYASATARGSALTGYISEGMISYLEDTNAVEVYNGSTWVGLGGDAPIFKQGTSGEFLKSLGTAGVEWDSVPSPSNATPTTAGLVYGTTPSSGPSGYTDFGSVGVGYSALTNGTAVGTTAMGWKAIESLTVGRGNTTIGCKAGQSITEGEYNVALGFRAGDSITTGDNNTLIGTQAGGGITTGSNNAVVGSSGYTGSYNSSLGNTYPFTHTGSYNTAIGYHVGYLAGASASGNNNTLIGANAEASSDTVSNQITLGDSNITSLRCAVTSISSLSDERDKTDITDLEVGLSFIKDLRPVRFTWNSRTPDPIERPDGTIVQPPAGKVGIPDMGFIAQDLVAAEDALEGHDFLQLTLRDNPDKLEASYGRLVPILVKAVQELSAEVETLKAQLAK